MQLCCSLCSCGSGRVYESKKISFDFGDFRDFSKILCIQSLYWCAFTSASHLESGWCPWAFCLCLRSPILGPGLKSPAKACRVGLRSPSVRAYHLRLSSIESRRYQCESIGLTKSPTLARADIACQRNWSHHCMKLTCSKHLRSRRPKRHVLDCWRGGSSDNRSVRGASGSEHLLVLAGLDAGRLTRHFCANI